MKYYFIKSEESVPDMLNGVTNEYTSIESELFDSKEKAVAYIAQWSKQAYNKTYYTLYEVDTEDKSVLEVSYTLPKKKVVKKKIINMICANCKFWLNDPTGNYCTFGKPNRITATVFEPKETDENYSCKEWRSKLVKKESLKQKENSEYWYGVEKDLAEGRHSGKPGDWH